MSACKIFPEIYNNKGELVESDFFKDLLKNGYTRAEANAKFRETRTNEFFNNNGNWLLYKDLTSGRAKVSNLYPTLDLANEAYAKFITIYGKDYVSEPVEANTVGALYSVKLKEISAGDIKVPLNSNGEISSLVILSPNQVNYNYRAVNLIYDNIDKVNKWFTQLKDTPQFWTKLQKDLQIPKDQIELISLAEGKNVEEKLINFTSNYSYTVEINTAKTSPLRKSSVYYAEENMHEVNDVETYSKQDAYEEVWREGIHEPNSKEFNDAVEAKYKAKQNSNSSYYAYLTVPGGTNYTENEIATPAITPSIKGHAQFSTDKGIGWFRSDEREAKEIRLNSLTKTLNQLKEDNSNPFFTEDLSKDIKELEDQIERENFKIFGNSKTRRILEVQSDLFQKSRGKEDLAEISKNKDGYLLDTFKLNEDTYKKDYPDDNPFPTYYKNNKEISNLEYDQALDKFKDVGNYEKENQFLQLLNKGNNWVKFFIKSIVQDSAKKGYEKVLFPSGNTASKVEGHTTLEEFKKQKEDRIEILEEAIIKYEKAELDIVSTNEIEFIETDSGGFSGIIQYKFEAKVPGGKLYGVTEQEIIDKFQTQKNRNLPNHKKEIAQLKQELERVNGPEGLNALKPIYNFYENIVPKILEDNYTVNKVTDEYGNTWNEIALTEKDANPIQFAKALPLEVKFFRQAVGIVKSEGHSGYKAKVNAAVEKFNAKYGTSHYVNWAKVGESTLFKITSVDYRWNGFNPTQNSLFNKQEVDTQADEVLQEVLDTLSTLSGLGEGSGVLITESEAKKLLGDAYNGEAGFFHNNQVYLVKGKAGLESAFHEFFHPIINQLFASNPALFNTLYNELQKTEAGRQIIQEVEELYSDLSEADKKKEAITTALGKLGKANYMKSKENQSLVTRIMNAIKQFLNKILGRKVNLNNLTANTTLQEFSEMLTGKKVVKLDKTLSNNIETTQFQKAPKQPITKDLQKIINQTEVIVGKQVAIYSARLAQGQTSKAVDRLKDILEKVRAVSEVADYLSAIENMIGLMNSSEKTLNELAAKGKFDRGDSSTLKNAEEFLESLSFLDDLNVLITRNKVQLDPKEGFQAILLDALNKKAALKDTYRELSLDYVSELLFNEINPAVLEETRQMKEMKLKKNPSDARAKLLITSKEDMRNHLEKASKDIGFINLWTYSTAASNDPALSLAALYTKRHLEQAADDTYVAVYAMNIALENYRKLKSKLSIDDPTDFNQHVSEVVEDIIYEYDEDAGKKVPKIIERLTLVNEFDITSFNRNYIKMLESMEKEKEKKARKKIYATWMTQNLEFIPNFQEVIDAKKASLSEEAYTKWLSDNTYNAGVKYGGLKPKFGGELAQPKKSIYENPKWVAMDEADREYYGVLQQTLSLHQQKLPESYKNKLKLANMNFVTVIPSRYKTKRERALSKDWKGLRKDIAESYKINPEREQKFGLVKLDGEPFYGIPIHHMQNMDINDISPDIFTNIVYFLDSVNKRQALASIEADMLLLKDVLNDREIERTTQAGETIYDAWISKERKAGRTKIPEEAEKEFGTNMSAKKFSEFVDMIYYGKSELPGGNWLFGKLSINQTVNKVIGLASLTQLAFNVPAAAANVLTGNISNISGSIGSRYWSPGDYFKASSRDYPKYAAEALKDLAKGMPSSKESRIVMFFDPIQGNFKDVKGRTISQSGFLREFRSDHLFMLNNGGEHMMQVTNLLAALNATKVTSDDGTQTVSLIDIIVDVDPKTNKLVLKDGFSISEAQTRDIKNKVHRVNQKLHGNYSEGIDKIMLQRRWYGRLVMMFRKYVIPGMQRRWDVEHFDYETNEFEAGIYVDAFEHFMTRVIGTARAQMKGAAMDLKALDQMNEAEKKKYLRQKAGFYQTMFELGTILLLMILGNLIIDEDDDEKDPKSAYFAALMMRRLRGDLSFYANPLEFINMVKNPTVSISYALSVTKFVLGLVAKFGEDEYYDRQVGPFEKGTSKDYARFLKILPIFRQIINIQSPEEQLKFYNLLAI